MIARLTHIILRRICCKINFRRVLPQMGLGLFLLLISFAVFSYTRAGVYTRTYTREASAATSSTLNFQGRLSNSAGNVVSDGTYSMEFNLYNASAGGTTQWTETQGAVTVKNGYFSVQLGSATSFPGTIDWSQEQWLTMNVNGDGEMSPRLKLTAVPYAFRAGQADSLTNGSGTLGASDILQKAPVTIQSFSSTLAGLRLNQTGSGGLIQLQGDGSDVFTVDKLGAATLGSSITLGNTSTTIPGTIRWNGSDLQGYTGSGWTSLTAGSGITNPFVNKTKTADETVNNSGVPPTQNTGATLQNDDQLFFSIGANETWNFRFVIQANVPATPDLKFAVTAPGGATCKVGAYDVDSANTYGNLACGAATGIMTGLTADDVYEVTGTIINGATPGNVTLQWSQNTANAANVTVRQGSFVEAQRSVGGGVAQAFIQDGNTFSAKAVLGTNDSNDLGLETNGVERLTILANGNVGVGDASPAALFTVGTSDALQITSAGNLSTTGTVDIGGLTTLSSSLIADNVATGTTATATGTPGSNTTIINLTGTAFANNDVIYINNAGQDYFTRIVSGGGTATLTVSPAVSYDASATIEKYNIQNIGATDTDYTNLANRFFQGYFLGGVVVGAGSTTLSDGNLISTGNLSLQANSGTGVVNISGDLNVTGELTGDGAGITNISASAIAAGTLDDGQLSANVALLSGLQTFTGQKTFSGGLIISASGLSNTGGLDNNSGGITEAGEISGVTNLSISGSISGGTTVTGSGDFNSTGGSIQTNSTNRIDNSGNLLNIGTLTLSGAISGGTSFTGSGDINTSAGALQTAGITRIDNSGNLSNIGSISAGGAISGLTTISLNGSISGGTSITGSGNFNSSGGSIQTNSIDRIDNSGNLVNIGALTLSGAVSGGTSFTGSGNINTTGGVIQTNSTTRIDNSGNLTNIGSISAGGSLSGVTTLTLSSSISGGTTISGSGNINTSAGSLQTAGITRIDNSGNLSNIGSISAGGAISGLTTISLNGSISGGTTVTGSGNFNTTGGSLQTNSTDRIDNSGNLVNIGALTLSGAISGGTSFTGSGDINTSAGTLQTAGITRIDNSGNLTNVGNITGTGALTLASGGSSNLTLNSASNAIVIDGTDTSILRTASGTLSFNLNDAADTSLSLTNSGTGVANLNISEGSLFTAGVNRLTNGGSLQNITGLTSSGSITFSGLSAGGIIKADGSGTLSLATAGTDYENPLTFGDGLTRTTNSINIGGALSASRDIDLGSNVFSFSGSGNVAIGSTSASGRLSVTDSSTSASLFANKTGASGNILTLQKNGNGVFTIANGGATQISTDSTTALQVRNAAGTSNFFTVDTAGSIIQVGSSTGDATGVLFVLDSKTGADPTGVAGAQYYNSTNNKFRCFENSAWNDCITPEPDTGNFDDTTPAAFAGDINTTELFNDATRPNITTNKTTANVQVTIHIGGLANTNNDAWLGARVVYTTDGSAPNCTTSLQVGKPMVAGFTTNNNDPYQIVGTFVHNPGVAALVRYTVCSSNIAKGATLTDTPTNVTVYLTELGN